MILLDIEGTTTPIAFVTGTLVPYARAHLVPFLEREGRAGEAPGLLAEMDRDSKSTALKEVQGRIWEQGYERGELIAPVYPDVAPAFARWRSQGHALGIFSSGSVLAQQCLFRRTTSGDLTPHLQWYFDTNTGPKREPASYASIAAIAGTPAAEILFISDAAAELDAARAAGMRTALADRPGNLPQPSHTHRIIHTFDELP